MAEHFLKNHSTCNCELNKDAVFACTSELFKFIWEPIQVFELVKLLSINLPEGCKFMTNFDGCQLDPSTQNIILEVI